MSLRHEEIGIKYLMEILGYKREDILEYFTSEIGTCKPDLMTKDGKKWEVKTLDSSLSRIFFTRNQLKFRNDVNILIFAKKYTTEPVGDGEILLHRNGEPIEMIVNDETRRATGICYKFLSCIKFGDIVNQEEKYGYISDFDGNKYYYRFMVKFEVDLLDADDIQQKIDREIDGRLFFLTGGNSGDADNYIYRCAEGHIRLLLNNAEGYDVSYILETFRSLYDRPYTMLNHQTLHTEELFDDNGKFLFGDTSTFQAETETKSTVGRELIHHWKIIDDKITMID